MLDYVDELGFPELFCEEERNSRNPKDERRIKYKRGVKHDANLKRKVKNSRYAWYHNYHWQENRVIAGDDCGKLEKPFMWKYYKSSNTDVYRFHKRKSNRKVRHATEIYNGGSYKKLYDCSWMTD